MMESVAIKCGSSLYHKLRNYSRYVKQLFIVIGLNWENITLLRDMMTLMRNRETHSVTQTLVVFIFKLRTGNFQEILVSILLLEYEQLISKLKN